MKTILFVDDEADIRLSLSYRLHAEGFRVFDAADGRQSLEAAEAHRPDLVIMDLKLPDMDGREAMRRIRSRSDTANVPVIYITADATVSPTRTNPTEVYLVKPFSGEDLLQQVRISLV